MEQFINYRVPPEKFDELAKYDGSVIVERTKGEISARCDKEGANFLALNLANDRAGQKERRRGAEVLRREKSVDEARKFYAETAQAMMKGEKPPIRKGSGSRSRRATKATGTKP
jgi:hypothetical protein